jgi:hypothetical protein
MQKGGLIMSSSFLNGLTAIKDAVSSQFQRDISHLKASETEVPTSAHAHRGNDDLYILSQENMNFQLYGSSDDIMYITGHDDNTTIDGGGNHKIYDFGTGANVVLHDQTPGSVIAVYNTDHDSRFNLYLHDFVNQTIMPDGRGGTLVGGVADIVNAAIPAAKVHFVNSDPSWVKAAATDLYPTPPHAEGLI